MRTLHDTRRTSQGMRRQHQLMARLRSSCILCRLNHNMMSYRIFTILSTLWYRSHPTIGSPRSYVSCTWIQTQYVNIRSPHPSNQAAQKVTQQHQQSCRNTPSITLEEQSHIRTTISMKA